MEKCLRSLQASLGGAVPTVNKGGLCELAQAFLTGEGSGHPNAVREKAGLLALLNLMGILEVFYAAGQPAEHRVSRATRESQIPTESAGQKTHPETPAGSRELSEPPQGVETAVPLPDDKEGFRLPLQPQASPDTDTRPEPAKPDALAPLMAAIPSLLAGKEGGIEPALVSAMLKLIASLSRTKPASTVKGGSPEGEPAQAPVDSGEPCAGETSKDDATMPSHHAGLGLDPKLIASLINFLAGVDRTKTESNASPSNQPLAEAPVKGEEKYELSLSRDGRSVLAKRIPQAIPPKASQQPPSFSQFLKQPPRPAKAPPERPPDSHKPGVGIRRGWSKQRRYSDNQGPDETRYGNKPTFACHR